MADFRLLARTHGLMKVCEIVIAFICVGLLRYYNLNFGGDITTGAFQDRYNTGLVTIGGFLLVSLPLLISYLWSPAGTYQPFLEIIYNIVGFILFLTVGCLAVDHYRRYAEDHWASGPSMLERAKYVFRGDIPTNASSTEWDHYGNHGQHPYGENNYTTTNVAAGQAMGALCIINSLFYLTDAILAFRQGSNV